MRMQELFETTEEDRALISLSSAIYDKIIQYADGTTGQTVHLGNIGDLFDSPLDALHGISIDIQNGTAFNARAFDVPDDDAIKDVTNAVIYAFWEEDTETIVLNSDKILSNRMKTTITHELRHALDFVKSNKFPGDAVSYFTPRKKEHRKVAPGETIRYRAQPAEINARFTEILDILTKRIPKWYEKLDSDEIKPQLTRDFNNLLNKFEIADLFPERTASTDFKRLVKRAYDFMQKEMAHVESELAKAGTVKPATGNW